MKSATQFKIMRVVVLLSLLSIVLVLGSLALHNQALQSILVNTGVGTLSLAMLLLFGMGVTHGVQKLIRRYQVVNGLVIEPEIADAERVNPMQASYEMQIMKDKTGRMNGDDAVKLLQRYWPNLSKNSAKFVISNAMRVEENNVHAAVMEANEHLERLWGHRNYDTRGDFIENDINSINVEYE